MPYRGDLPQASTVDDGTNRLLSVLGASALLYPVLRTLLEIPWLGVYDAKEPDPSLLNLLRITGYAVFSLHFVPAFVAFLLARKNMARDTRLLYGIGGAVLVIGLGLELVPTESIGAYRWLRVIAAVLVGGGVSAIALGVARTRRANEDNDVGVILSSVIALSAGAIVGGMWWLADGYMSRSDYGWTSYTPYSSSERRLELCLGYFAVLVYVGPLALLGVGALVRARARQGAPVMDEVPKEHAVADDVVLRLRAARNVLVAFALAALAASLPVLVLLAGMIVRNSGPIGVRQIARVLVVLQGVLAASLVMAFVASGGEVKDDDRPMRRGVFLGLLVQLVVIGILLGVTDLETDLACGLWSLAAAATIFGHAELARGVLLRGMKLAPANIPEGIAPYVEELRRLVRYVAIGVAVSCGTLFLGNRASDASSISTFALLGSLATIFCGAGAVVAAARARRVLDRAFLWRLSEAR